MVGNLLLRGMLAGVLAGLCAAIFAYIFGEPSIDLAIAFEDHAASMSGEAAEPELVSRAVQSTLGLAVGILAIGIAVGGIFAIAYAFAQGRLGRLSPSATAAVLALAGFVVVVLVPQLKYPANPPSVGSADTIGARTELYFAMLALSVVAAVAAFAAARQLAARMGSWNGHLAGLALYIVLIGLVMTALPHLDEVPNGFSADLLWRFRLASFGIGAVLWGALGVVFGYLCERWPLSSAKPRPTY